MPTDYKRAYTEDELLFRLREGDEWVIAALFHKHFDTLMVVAQRFLTFEKAQDVVQEAFWKFWTARHEFDAEAAIYQWLKVTVRNGALNLLRSERRAELRESTVAAEQMKEAMFFFQSEVESELFQRIVCEIDTLPDRQQKIIKLFFLDGMDNGAIAAELGITVQAVKNQKVTALKVLRSSFSKEDLLLILAGFLGPFHKF